MRLDSLTLAFKSYRQLTIPTAAPRVLFVGRNGVGKSSIREAVRWVLRNVAQGTDAKGAGAEVLIPTGSDTASVGLTIAGLGAVTRGLSVKAGSTFSVAGFTGPAGAQHQALYDRLGVTAAYLDAVLESSTFLALNHAAAKALVLQLLNVRIEIPGHERPYTLDDLDALYASAFEARKLAKRELKNLPIVPEPPAPVGGVYDEAQIDAQLAKLREQAVEIGKTVGGAQAQRTNLQNQLALHRRALQEAKEVIAASEIATVQAEIQALEREITAAVKVATAPAVPSSEVTDEDPGRRVAFLRGRLEAIAAHKPTQGCVLDPDVPCETSKPKFAKQAKKISEEIATLEEAVPGDRLALEPPQDDSKLRRLDALKRRAEAHGRAVDLLPVVEAEIATTEAQIAALPSVAEQDAELAQLRERIGHGEALQKTTRAYLADVTRHEEAQRALRAKQQEIVTLEQTVDALGPNGVRVAALEAAMGRFLAAINEFTGKFGLAVSFVLDPWAVLVNDRPVETYSRSEQYRIGIAIQLAVAALSGIGFAIVDELDILDTEFRNIMGRLIHQAPIEQILIMQTREDNQPLPQLPGWLVHRIGKTAEGTSIIVESGLA